MSRFWTAIVVYWLPLSFCAAGYTVRTWRRFSADRRRRDTDGRNYYPTDTIGSLIGRAFVTVLPIGNAWAALFDLAPELFREFFEWVSKVFNQPLVPKRERG